MDYNKVKKGEFRQAVDHLKKLLGCCFCEESASCCLDFHHPFENKEKGVSYWVAGKSFENIVNEISKCVCVCSNCHRKIHAGLLECVKETIDKLWVESTLKNHISVDKKRFFYTEK